MRNPYEYEPEEEPRVCATCARFFEFDQVCNVPETVVKAMKERFGIALGDSEIAIEPDKITDCTEWVSARILDRNALYEAKQEAKAKGMIRHIGITNHRNNQIAIIQRNGNTDIDMFLEQDIISLYRYIHLRVSSQRLRHSFCDGRHIRKFHSLTTEESIFILFAPTHQFGDVYFYHIGYMRRYFLRHNHVVGNNPADTIHLFYFDSRHCYRSNLRTCLFRRNSN